MYKGSDSGFPGRPVSEGAFVVRILRTLVSSKKISHIFVTFEALIFTSFETFRLLAFRIMKTLIFLAVALFLSLIPRYFYTPYSASEFITHSQLDIMKNSLTLMLDSCAQPLIDPNQIAGEAARIMQDAPPEYSDFTVFGRSLPLYGFYSPLSGKAYVNTGAPEELLPFIAVHELSHRAGYLNEAQANFHAFRGCMLSESDAFRYSACVYALSLIEELEGEMKAAAESGTGFRAAAERRRSLPWSSYRDFLFILAAHI